MWEVQTNTLCQGWINTWTSSERVGDKVVETPWVFKTRKEAQKSLNDFFAEVDEAVADGDSGNPETRSSKGLDVECKRNDYRIVRCKHGKYKDKEKG